MALSINGETIFETVIIRLLTIFPAESIFIATTDRSEDDILSDIAHGFGVHVFRGDNDDVLSRFSAIAEKVKTKFVCRLTGDSPLIMPELVNEAHSQLKFGEADYVSTTLGERFPVGAHVEVFRLNCLTDRMPKAPDATQREHVTPFIYNNSEFKCEELIADNKYPPGRYTLDYLSDFHFFYKLAKSLDLPLSQITVDDLWRIKAKSPEIFEINISIKKQKIAQ